MRPARPSAPRRAPATQAQRRTGPHLGGLVAQALTAGAGAGRRRLVYAYHRDLDLTGHARGASGLAAGLQLRHVDLLAEFVAERLPRGAVLVVTGDHGMADLRPDERVDLADHPELAAGVRLLAGEARARHVHAVEGAAADVLDAWRAILGEAMWVAAREEAIAAGWFGPRMLDLVRPRIGDVVAATATPIGVFDRRAYPGEAAMVGHHGSMTPKRAARAAATAPPVSHHQQGNTAPAPWQPLCLDGRTAAPIGGSGRRHARPAPPG